MVQTITSSGYGPNKTETYDNFGQLASVTDAIGHTINYTGYNGMGWATTVTDQQNGFVVNYTFDDLGHVVTMSRTLDNVQATTTYAYDGLGDITSITYPDGVVSYTYNGAGRLTAKFGSETDTTNPNMQRTTTTQELYAYNGIGMLISMTGQTDSRVCLKTDGGTYSNCSDNITTLYSKGWGYDSFGRLGEVSGNNGQKFRTTYDNASNIATVEDSLNNMWVYNNYNDFNQVLKITNPSGSPTGYTYDHAGNLASVTDPNGNTTQYKYDGFGQLVQQISPDSHTTSYAYNNLGQLQQLTKPDLSVINYTSYDADGRLNSVYAPATAHAPAQSISYVYDCTGTGVYGFGRLCGISDSSGSTNYTYRKNGQLAGQVAVINGASYTVTYAYDTRERLASLTYPGGTTVNYQYNSRSEPTTVTATMGGTTYNVATSMAYVGTNLGPRTSMTYGDGSIETRTYDKDLRLTGISNSATGVQSLSYGYDANNNATSITNGITSGYNQTFGYDNLARLTNVTSAGLGNQTIAFDSNGNRTTYATSSGTDTYSSPNGNNRIPGISGAHSRSFSYDPNFGNITGETGSRGAFSYTYDVLNHLSTLTSNGASTNYTYNAMGQRVQKSGAGGSYNFIYSTDGTLLGETSSGGANLTTLYVWLQGQPIALIRNGSLYFIHSDNLGRPDTVTDSSQAIVWRAANNVFDRTVTVLINSFGPLNISFPGQYYDAESGMYYNLNRYYDPTLGRYTQSDPVNLFGGLNTYTYAGNQPMSEIDPSGLLFMTTMGIFMRGTSEQQAIEMGTPGTAAVVYGLVGTATEAPAIAGEPALLDAILQGGDVLRNEIVKQVIKAMIKNHVSPDATPPPEPPSCSVPLSPTSSGSAPGP